MNKYLDSERNGISLGHYVAVWDNCYKEMIRCEVIGFTPQKVKIKPICAPDYDMTVIKYPSDLLIIKK